MKWYANYTGVGEYDIINETDRAREIAETENTAESDRAHELQTMAEFPNFAAAKKWVKEGIECDISSLKLAMNYLKKERAK